MCRKPHLKACLLRAYGTFISEEMYDAIFEFDGKFVQGLVCLQCFFLLFSCLYMQD